MAHLDCEIPCNQQNNDVDKYVLSREVVMINE